MKDKVKFLEGATWVCSKLKDECILANQRVCAVLQEFMEITVKDSEETTQNQFGAVRGRRDEVLCNKVSLLTEELCTKTHNILETLTY
jgi:hypothetical protein